MVVRIGMLRKKPEATVGAFGKYWREVHGLLGAALPGLRRYHQNHVIEMGPGLDLPRGAQTFDGFSELWFDDPPAMAKAFTPETSRKLAADEARFTSDLRGIAVEQHVVAAGAPGATRLLKHMSLLKRRAGTSPEEFRRAYRGAYAELVGALPGLKGYTQNVVVDRNVEKGGRSARYEEVPVDGVDELWFEDRPGLDAALASAAGRAAGEAARRFVDAATPFVVETLVYVA